MFVFYLCLPQLYTLLTPTLLGVVSGYRLQVYHVATYTANVWIPLLVQQLAAMIKGFGGISQSIIFVKSAQQQLPRISGVSDCGHTKCILKARMCSYAVTPQGVNMSLGVFLYSGISGCKHVTGSILSMPPQKE